MRSALRPSVAAALALAVLAPGAAAQEPAAGLEDLHVEAAIPQIHVVSPQYPDVETAVDEIVAAAPPAAPTAPEPVPAPAAPTEYQPSPEQYHSEEPDVSVTTDQPSNVNVSIRINSPGDNGPVMQIGGGAPSQPAPAPRPRPEAPRPAPDPSETPDAGDASGMPGDWEWVWTSACFGAGGPAAARAAASAPDPRWRWRWSCDDAEEAIGPADDVVDVVDDAVAGDLPALAPVADLLPGAGPSAGAERPAPSRPPGAGDRAATSRPDRRAPTAAAGPPPAPRIATAARAPAPFDASPDAPATAAGRAAHDGHRAARPQPRATGQEPAIFFPPGAGGLAAGPASGLGLASALALGAWIAVLTGALVLVLPRLRRRRWSGPSRRQPQPRASRLERPG